jgi:hypothetical protein
VQKKKSTYSIKEVLNEYWSKNRALAHRIKSFQALEMWDTVVDSSLHSHTAAVTMNDGILFVNTDSAPLANELSLQEKELREKLNGKLVFPVVKKIVFKSGYIPKNKAGKNKKNTQKKNITLGMVKKIEETVKDVKEDELREILKRFFLAAAEKKHSDHDSGDSSGGTVFHTKR